jgi:hypothetical protein
MTSGPDQRGLVRSTLLLLEERIAEVERRVGGSEEGTLCRRRSPGPNDEQRARAAGS